MAHWKKVKGFPYEVSDQGEIRRIGGRILKPGTTQKGYKLVALFQAPEKSSRYVHHLVLEAFIGDCPAGHQCRHINGDPADNRIGNLAWGTPAQNQFDREAHGTSNHGERNGMHKLKDEDVVEIRRLLRTDKTQAEIARRFGVTQSHICRINCGDVRRG